MREFVLCILNIQLGQAKDDFNRASLAFKHYSEKQLNEPYGENPESPQIILGHYLYRCQELEKAIKWVEMQD